MLKSVVLVILSLTTIDTQIYETKVISEPMLENECFNVAEMINNSQPEVLSGNAVASTFNFKIQTDFPTIIVQHTASCENLN